MDFDREIILASFLVEAEEGLNLMEQALVEAMVACLASAEAAEVTATRLHHRRVMRRFEEVLEANPDRTLYLAELCAATGVSARTLLACCQEHLGMGPKRYLLLRRMHLARRALLMGDPATTTVTEITTNFGFWELGRFAVAYRSLFGEMPSASLRRTSDGPHKRKSHASPL